MSLSARTLRIWAIAIGGMGLLDALHVLVAAHITAGNSRATTGWVGFCMAHPWVLALPVFVYAAAWIRFVRRTDRIVWGAAAFAMLFLVVRVWTTAYATGHQDFIQGGATMLGWLLGGLWARALGHRPSRSPEERLEVDRYAATGALALFAATYVCAGTSKLVNTQLGWTGAVTIRLMAISHLRVDDTSWLAGVKLWLAHNPHAGTALQHATVVVQAGAVVALLGKWPRAVWCAALSLLHVGIYLSSGIVFLTPLVLAAVFAIPWDGRRSGERVSGTATLADAARDTATHDTPHDTATHGAATLPPGLSPARARRVMAAAAGSLAVVLGLVWLTPVGPALRFQVQPWQLATSPAASRDDKGEPPRPAPASPAARALLGGLPEGASLGGCILRAVSGPAEVPGTGIPGLTLAFDCPRGPATLWLLRRGRAPFVPPASTKRLDILTKGERPEGGPTSAELAELVAAVTARIAEAGEEGELPEGL